MKAWFLGLPKGGQYTIVIGALVLAFGVPGCGSDDKKPDHSQAADAPASNTTQAASDIAETAPPPPAQSHEKPNADGSYKLDCAYELGDFGDSGDPSKGFRFVAGGTLTNTGNIGIRVRVTYKWKLLGRGPLVVHKTYRVRRGESRDVNLTVPVSSDDIDAHQNAHGDCSTHGVIVSTFGTTPLDG